MRPGSCSVDGLHGPASPEENGVFLATGLAVNVSLVVAVSLLTFGIVSLFTMCIPPSYKNNHITILRKNCQRSLRWPWVEEGEGDGHLQISSGCLDLSQNGLSFTSLTSTCFMGKPLSLQDFWGSHWPRSATAARCPAFPIIPRQHDPGLPRIEEAKRCRKGDKRPWVELFLPHRSAFGFCLCFTSKK